MDQKTAKIFILSRKVLFPHCNAVVQIRHSTFTDSLNQGDMIIAYPVRNIFDILLIKRRVSTYAEITGIESSEERITLQLKGLSRVKVKKVKRIHEATFTTVQSGDGNFDLELLKEIRKKTQELVFLINVDESDKLISLMNFLYDLNQITDFIANYFILDFRYRIDLLNDADVKTRSIKLLHKLDQLINRMGQGRT